MLEALRSDVLRPVLTALIKRLYVALVDWDQIYHGQPLKLLTDMSGFRQDIAGLF